MPLNLHARYRTDLSAGPSAVDEKTLKAARRGNREAFGILLRDLQDPWYRMSLSLLGDSDLARDATQETAVRFVRQLRTFRGDSQLRTWSLGICLNVVRELRRSRRGQSLLEDETGLPPRWDPYPSPDAAAERAEESESLRAVLAGLPERQREALVLRFFEDLSVEQTARAMRCAKGTVKATVHQALRSLRRRLRQLAPDVR